MRQKGSEGKVKGTKVCPICKKEFKYKLNSKKYCSNACKCRLYYPETSKKKHRFQGIVSNIKQRDPNSELTLRTVETLFIQQKGLCAITGFPMTSIRGIGMGLQKENMFNVSVDRVDQTKGYTLDNIRLVCVQANMMRSILSDEELVLWCQAIKTNLTKEAQRKKRAAKNGK